MSYQGSFAVGSVIDWIFATTVDGVPTVFSGSPALSVYKNSLTQSTTGVTLSVDYDGVTGMNHVVIDTSSDSTFYADQTQFSVVISTGTVGGNSVVGRPVGSFSIDAETIRTVGFVSGGVGGTVSGVVAGIPRVIIPGNRS